MLGDFKSWIIVNDNGIKVYENENTNQEQLLHEEVYIYNCETNKLERFSHGLSLGEDYTEAFVSDKGIIFYLENDEDKAVILSPNIELPLIVNNFSEIDNVPDYLEQSIVGQMKKERDFINNKIDYINDPLYTIDKWEVFNEKPRLIEKSYPNLPKEIFVNNKVPNFPINSEIIIENKEDLNYEIKAKQKTFDTMNGSIVQLNKIKVLVHSPLISEPVVLPSIKMLDYSNLEEFVDETIKNKQLEDYNRLLQTQEKMYNYEPKEQIQDVEFNKLENFINTINRKNGKTYYTGKYLLNEVLETEQTEKPEYAIFELESDIAEKHIKENFRIKNKKREKNSTTYETEEGIKIYVHDKYIEGTKEKISINSEKISPEIRFGDCFTNVRAIFKETESKQGFFNSLIGRHSEKEILDPTNSLDDIKAGIVKPLIFRNKGRIESILKTMEDAKELGFNMEFPENAEYYNVKNVGFKEIEDKVLKEWDRPSTFYNILKGAGITKWTSYDINDEKNWSNAMRGLDMASQLRFFIQEDYVEVAETIMYYNLDKNIELALGSCYEPFNYKEWRASEWLNRAFESNDTELKQEIAKLDTDFNKILVLALSQQINEKSWKEVSSNFKKACNMKVEITKEQEQKTVESTKSSLSDHIMDFCEYYGILTAKNLYDKGIIDKNVSFVLEDQKIFLIEDNKKTEITKEDFLSMSGRDYLDLEINKKINSSIEKEVFYYRDGNNIFVGNKKEVFEASFVNNYGERLAKYISGKTSIPKEKIDNELKKVNFPLERVSPDVLEKNAERNTFER